MPQHRMKGVVFVILLGIALVYSASQLAAQAPTITYIYDDLGRLVRVINAQDECATYAYDAVGNILSITRSTNCRQPPAVEGLSQDFARIGETVCLTITGNNFLGATVAIDNPEVQISDVHASETGIEVCLTTSRMARLGSAQLRITTPVGVTFTTLVVLGFLPRIVGIFPTQGPPEGGTPVTIAGTNFTSETTVLIGGNLATDVVFVNAGTLTARTPAGTLGLADVVVQNSNGSTALAGGFRYTFQFGIPGAIAVATGSTGTLPVTLARASATDITVAVVSADPMVATVPGSVVIPAGATSAGISITAVSEGTTTVTVTIGATSRQRLSLSRRRLLARWSWWWVSSGVL